MSRWEEGNHYHSPSQMRSMYICVCLGYQAFHAMETLEFVSERSGPLRLVGTMTMDSTVLLTLLMLLVHDDFILGQRRTTILESEHLSTSVDV